MNPIFDTATTLGKIFAFLGVSAICGVLVAGLLVPAAAVSGSAASGSIDFFETLPAELKVEPPSQSTKVLAADGSVIANLYEQNRTRVSLDQISPYMKDAVVAVEDSRFYEHGGVDATGIMRALASTARGHKQGASTITQQYVNNVLNASLEAEGNTADIKLNGGNNKKVGDKLREMKLAIALEKEFSKEQILEGYLNIVFFNRDAYGIEAASKFFFSTSAKDLTLPQAALLAGLVNSPSAFDPLSNPDNAKSRRDLVLGLMLGQNKITQAEHDVAVATPIEPKVTPSKQGCAYGTTPYFCDYVLHLLLNNPAYGEDPKERQDKILRGGLTITTTLDPNAQNAAQAQVDASAGANPDKWGAALVSVQPNTGKIINMAQNTVWLPADGKFQAEQNFNVDQFDANGNDLNGLGGAQPGSTMKPFTFAEWLNEGKSMNTPVNAANRKYPLSFKWRNTCGVTTGAYNSAEKNQGAAEDLQNADDRHYRSMSVLEGLYNSINTATFASAAQLDFCGIQKMMDATGLHSGLPMRDPETGQPLRDSTGKIAEPNPKINMGFVANLLGSTQTSPLTMASAFATFANDGKYCAPIAITSVTDQTGAQLPAQSSECRDAVKPEVARGVNFGLQEVLNRGSGALIQPRISTRTNFPIAAKTGTSNLNESTWVVGHTTGLATAAWFGDPLGDQSRQGRDLTFNGVFYPNLDGYMIAGPMFSKFMAQIAPAYGTNPFPAPGAGQGAQAPAKPPAPAPAVPPVEPPANPVPPVEPPANPAPPVEPPANPAPPALPIAPKDDKGRGNG